MNRKNLTAAVLAGLAGAAGIVGSAQAVNINPDGLGQVLIYPYYTVNGGNQTLLSVVNTSDEAKAVKVRFKEGKNSREVLDFNLYMSMYDVWTAAIVDAPVACIPEEECDAAPTLYTTDTSCTVPYIYGNGGAQEFLPWGMNDTGVPDEYGSINRATEGYFEMIDMGVLTGDSALAATHVNGMPDDCAQLVRAWTTLDDKDDTTRGYWVVDRTVDIEAPVGGLFGGAAIINVQAGHMYSYDAKAINDYSTPQQFISLHFDPGTSQPSLNSGDVLDGDVFVDGAVLNSGPLPRGVDAMSFVFMHDQIMNEYSTELEVGGGTEWVLTFPTKSFYVYEDESGSDVALAPFTEEWDGEGACEVVVLDTIWDREEMTIVNPDVPGGIIPPIVSPAPPDPIDPVNPIFPFTLCYETSVIRFLGELVIIPDGDPTPILGSSNSHSIDNGALGFENGWARLGMHDYTHDQNENGVIECIDINDDGNLVGPECLYREPLGNLEGLPVTGFAVNRFLNAFSGPGLLANYGGIFQHKYTRKLGSGAPVVPQP